MNKLKNLFYKQANHILPLALASSFGALTRFQINNYFIANIFGSLILGLSFGLNLRAKIKLLLGAAFCGSLTTFSGWIFNCLNLINKGLIYEVIILIFSMLFLSFLSLYIGYYIGKLIKNLMRLQ